MRKFLVAAVLSLFLIGGLGYIRWPVNEDGNRLSWSQGIRRIWYKKDVEVTGTQVLTQEEVFNALPLKESIAWWIQHESAIETDLLKNPLIKAVSLSRNGCLWGCFQVQVEERDSKFAAMVNQRAWVIGSDGAFIAPIPKIQTEEELQSYLSTNQSPLVLVRSIDSVASSPDLVTAQLRLLNDMLPVIESEVGKKILQVSVAQEGELEVRFEQLPFRANFDYSQRDLSELGKQAHRLSLLLSRFSDRESTIKSVDLAFDKLAVVRVNEEPHS